MMASLILVGTRVVPFLLQAAGPNSGGMTGEDVDQIALEAVRHQSSVNGVLALLVPYAVFAMVVIIVWLKIRQRQAQLQARAEFHKQLLDKFGTGREFAEFLESPGSQKFMEGLWSKTAEQPMQNGILRPLRNGIVLTMLGLAMTGLSWMHKGLLIPGVILLALGVGYLIMSAIAYRLSQTGNQPKDAGPGNALPS